MEYKRYHFVLLSRLLLLVLFISLTLWCISKSHYNFLVLTVPGALISYYYLTSFLFRRFRAIDDFFQSVKYRDFSRWFNEKSGPSDLKILHQGFNEVNRTIQEINTKKEAQYLYLKKILEMVDTGIIAYNLNTLEILWVNDSFNHILNIPSLKSIDFVKKRRPVLYKQIFEAKHGDQLTITIEIDEMKIPLLISESVFKISDQTFKLLVLQDIDKTLHKNESEAWRKLLSVMTHEIMNSIAPISSLAETLHNLTEQIENNGTTQGEDLKDLQLGIQSIRQRSEGLMQFAKTYRSLNKAIHLNLITVKIQELFASISKLMQPTLEKKAIEINYNIEHPKLDVVMDQHLVEQVLINLILNAIESKKENDPLIIELLAKKTENRQTAIEIKDNGGGIPAEILDTIFVPFFTTKRNGSGIGLSLSKQIMTLHNGNIQVQSKENEGTTIILLFPAVHA